MASTATYGHSDEVRPPSTPPAELDNFPRWSFLTGPTPDLSLAPEWSSPAPTARPNHEQTEEDEARSEDGQGKHDEHETDDESSNFDEEDEGEEDLTDEGVIVHARRGQVEREMEMESPWTTPEVVQGEFGELPPRKLSMAAMEEAMGGTATSSKSNGLLSAPSATLNRSTGSAPDSFVDPYMAAPPPTPSSPPSSSYATPLPPSTPSPPSPAFSESQQLRPPPSFGATPSPPRFDLAGRLLPSAPPSNDPFALALANAPANPPRSPRSRLGSLRGLSGLTRPFHRSQSKEDLTTSTFASTASSGYWDNSVDVSGVPHSSDVTGEEPVEHLLTSTPAPSPSKRPGPSPLNIFRRSWTEPAGPPLAMPSPAAVSPRVPHTVVDVRPLPALPVSTSTSTSPKSSYVALTLSTPPRPSTAPDASSGHSKKPSIAIRRSISRLPSLSIPTFSSPRPSPDTSLPSSSPSFTRSPLRIIERSADGFYRPPHSPRRSPHHTPRDLPPPTPLSSGFPPASPFGTTPVSSFSNNEMAFPLPPPPPSAGGKSATSNPFSSNGGRTREGTNGSESEPRTPWSAKPLLLATGTGGGGNRGVPSFVGVFNPPSSSTAGGRNPFGTEAGEDEEEDDPFARDAPPAAMAYPPLPRQVTQHSRLDSLSSSVLDPSRPLYPTAVRHRLPSTLTHSDTLAGPAAPPTSVVEKKRRTQAWLADVDVARSPSGESDQRSVMSSAATTGSGSKVRWATSRVGWSIRGEREEKLMPAAQKERQEEEEDGAVRTSSSSRKRRNKGGGVKGWYRRRSKRTRYLLFAALAALLILVVGVAVGLSHRTVAEVGDCSCEHGGTPTVEVDGTCSCACKSGWGGTSCHLNSTCVGGLAQGIVDVANTASGLFQPPVNTTRLATVFQRYILPSSSSSSSTDCSSQLSLLTLPSLSTTLYPTRLSWSESALLHTLSLSESNTSLSTLRTFISGLSFSQYGDEAATKPNSNYQVIVGGYLWDVGRMERTTPEVSGGWAKVSGADDDAQGRIARAGEEVQSAMERLTNEAVAAGTERKKALSHYFNDTLGLSSTQLDAFRTAVAGAEIVVPVDMTASDGGVAMTDLAAQARAANATFPPALGCWAELSDDVVARVNAVEETVMGLSGVSSGQAGNATCLNRPVYGILNLLNLRLPFSSSDSRLSLPQQSLVLRSSASLLFRTTLHAGELLSSGALSTSPTSPSSPSTIERFGLLSSSSSMSDHVLLDYLTLLSPSTAQALVAYIVAASTTPPASTSELWTLSNALKDVPTMEVMIWGGVGYGDIDFARSGLTYPASSSSFSSASSVFFGSTAGAALRSWALPSTNSTSSSTPAPFGRIDWVDSAEDDSVATDTSVGGSAAFEKVWASSAGSTEAKVWAAMEKAGLTS